MQVTQNTEGGKDISREQTELQPEISNKNTDQTSEKELLRKQIVSEEDQDHIDLELTTLNLQELIDLARKSMQSPPRIALKKIQMIRPVFFDRFLDEKKKALQEFIEEDGEESDFHFKAEDLSDQFNELLTLTRNTAAEEKKRIEEEKISNLHKKEVLLTNLAEIVAQDETEQSIDRVKEIQREWKSIRVLPKDKIAGLWERYHMLLDTFYDNHSINIELKELDRKKNLELKIELTKKVSELLEEPSLKRSFVLLNKYHDEYKHIGPVPRESREGIWEAFKAASDAIYDAKRKEFEANQAKREENLKKKELLVEKLSLISQPIYEHSKDWKVKAKEIDAIFEEWKSTGPVPKAQSDKIWKRFNEERNLFYHNKKAFFAEDHKKRKANLILKEDLCKRVELLKDEEDFNTTTHEIIQIQKNWKEIGPVPDKVNQAIWSRFRAACDYFFERKKEAFAGQQEEESRNLEIKTGLISELEALKNADIEDKEAFEKLKQISATWRDTGFIPRKELKRVNTTYEKLSDELFGKFRKSNEKLRTANMGEHYQHLAGSPNGHQRLKDEEFRIKKKITALNEEILNLEQNMSFFAKSKTADKLLKDFEQKLQRSKSKIEHLKVEVKMIKSAKANLSQQS